MRYENLGGDSGGSSGGGMVRWIRCGGSPSWISAVLLTISQSYRTLLWIDGEQTTLITNICLRDQADLRAQLWHTTAHLDSDSVALRSMWFYGIHDTIWRNRPADSNGRRRTTCQECQRRAAHAPECSHAHPPGSGVILKWRKYFRCFAGVCTQ